ncbi:MAG: acyl-CoA thioesterase [Gammaproteobacteria bacterium]|nr:acyl-CoA thioesterase [Gammaproteobacteria bacterium]
MHKDKLPHDKDPVLRLMPMPRDTNSAGNIFGGWIMSQVDIAGSVVAIRRAKGRVVTVAVSEFQFHKPVFVGDLISCYADVTKVGNTSLTVFVEVFAERGRMSEIIKVTEATLTYVAVDDEGKPRLVEQGS